MKQKQEKSSLGYRQKSEYPQSEKNEQYIMERFNIMRRIQFDEDQEKSEMRRDNSKHEKILVWLRQNTLRETKDEQRKKCL